jgi:beta-glucanase (GH16 family)
MAYKRTGMVLVVIPALLLAGCGGSSATSSSSPTEKQWTLVWSDEFDGANGSSPDATKWKFDIGVGEDGWGNNELEYYTSRTQNAYLQDGTLVIQALKGTYTDQDGIARDYTSARLKTAGRYQLTYGRVEARIKIPYGQGLWPAFWMLGNDFGQVDWPFCGEIDIMENIGLEPSTVHGTIHGPGYSDSGLTGSYTLSGSQRFADAFHVFAVEWEQREIRFYVDSILYQTVTPADLPAGTTWVFDHPFFILLNVAVGGDWPGSPDASTVFPQTMTVDYVRVYQRK